jgi:hypothetical protein
LKTNSFIWLICISLLLSVLGSQAAAIQVGLYKDRRTYSEETLKVLLEKNGIGTRILTKKELTAEDLSDLDVICFLDGWGSYKFLGVQGRKLVADFVAHGKGVMATAFRSGPVRTANRPMFPEVAFTWNRVNGNYVFPKGTHSLLAGVKEPICVSSWDHLVLRTGWLGRTFMVDGDDLPVAVYGHVLNGRYIALGWFVGLSGKATTEGAKRVFLNSVRWLAAGPRLEGDALARSQQEAETWFWRQDKVWDYARGVDKGPDGGPGIIPAAKYDREIPLKTVFYRLGYYEQNLEGEDKEAVAVAARSVQNLLDKLERNYRSILDARISELKAMNLEALRADDPEAFKEGLEERLLPGAVIEPIVANARRVLTKYGPALAAAKKARAAAERVRDLASVKELIRRCDSKDLRQRRRAAQELGRIGDKRASRKLIRMIGDSDEQVRKHAVLALGWMQEKKAVSALRKAASGSDAWLRRRAVQALGLIGRTRALGLIDDDRAVKDLLALLKHPDVYTRENAIFSLGWLCAGEAVPALVEIIKASDRQNPEQRAFMCAAIRALGHIGDKRSSPVLKEMADTANDFPLSRRGNSRYKNIHSTAQSLGLQGFSELAIREIESESQRLPGIRQPDYLSRRHYFYGLREEINFLGGRPNGVLNFRFKERPEELADHLWSAGGTGFHNAWGMDGVVKDYKGFLQKLDEREFRWVEVMPTDKNIFGRKAFYKNFLGNRVLHKPGAEETVFFAQDIPSFSGFWSEEVYPRIEVDDAAFEAYLKQKYGQDFRKVLSLDAQQKIAVPTDEQKWQQKKLWAEYLTLAGDMIIEDWRESQEWLHGLRKGCAFAFSVSARACKSHAIGVYPRAGQVIDAHGPESYGSYGRDNTFSMDLARDGEVRPVMCEFYNWYCQSPEHAERGFAAHLMHGESFFNFYLPHIFEQAPVDWLWVWQKGRWDKARRVFTKARKVKDYLGRTGSAANVALVYSDRSNALHYIKSLTDRDPRGRRYYQNQISLWVALQQSHIPTDTIWAETLTPEKLSRYRVAVLSDAKSLTPHEVSIIKNWVNEGGVLLATGTSTLFNQWGEQQPDYALAEVFGVSYKGMGGIADGRDSDSFAWERSQPPIKLLADGYDPEKIRTHVHREVKPVKSIRTFHTKEASQLWSIEPDQVFEYDGALGHDRVTIKKATVLATWQDGEPALMSNQFGKGSCLFWTPTYPGLSHTASGWEMYSNYFRFWPGTRELVENMIRGGLADSEARLPVEAANCPTEVELTVRTQDEHNRWIVHLLNYDTELDRVRGVAITVRPPSLRGLRVFYPDTNERIPFVRGTSDIRFLIRDFDVHEMIVVEYSVE